MIDRSKAPLMGRPHLPDPGLVEYIQMNYRDSSCTSIYQGINAVLLNITFNCKIKQDLPVSRCLIVILPRHQSGTKELHEKHALVIRSFLKASVTRNKI